jgi:hypothetical protein
MVRSLLFVLFVTLGLRSEAQVAVTPNPLSANFAVTVTDFGDDIYITNNKDTTYTIYWQLIKDATWPATWDTYMCDLNLCYLDNVDKSSNNLPNSVTMGTHKFSFHIKPNGTAGANNVTLKLFAEKNMASEVFSSNMSFSTTTSSTKDNSVNAIKIYPNPATEYIMIGNAPNVYRVVVYNLFGKEVKSFFHFNGAQHDVEDLKSGMYVVKLFDSKNKVLKSIKLNKSYSGA